MTIIAIQIQISYFALIGVFALIVSRTLMMRKKGIRVMVFGKTDKSDFLLLIVIALLIYPAIANAAGLPMWQPLVTPFWANSISGWIGLSLCVLAIIGLIFTLHSFGESVRVGIDEENPGKLVTTGMFRVSRNPLYLCIIIFFFGFFFIHRNVVAAAIIVFVILAVHRQILREEAFLKKHYGSEFDLYCAKTRRYI